jgi:hypothetical protein
MFAMKKYVGAANILPDSRTPRRLPQAMTATMLQATATRGPYKAGKADVIAWTPAATLTATVST